MEFVGGYMRMATDGRPGSELYNLLVATQFPIAGFSLGYTGGVVLLLFLFVSCTAVRRLGSSQVLCASITCLPYTMTDLGLLYAKACALD
jgi:hypothetical protein